MRIGAIEAGGTKFVCGIGNEHGEIIEKISFPTTMPDETLQQVIAFFRKHQVDAIGIGAFGPIDIDKNSSTYGYVTTTPKPGWANFNFIGELKREFDVPYGWDTDVNAAAYGEAIWGAAKGLDSCVYFTIGTGVGLGVYVEGKLVHGLVHPEAGHIAIRRHAEDSFAGVCPFHADCLEGMASGPAIEKRWETKGNLLPADHQAWQLEAEYISQAVVNVILTISPKKVILGGGVMKQAHLFPMIRKLVQQKLNHYLQVPELGAEIDSYIVPPGLVDQAGLCGALALGIAAYKG